MAIEKKLNKLLIGLVIGTTIAGVAGSQTKTGKKITQKATSGVLGGVKKIINFFEGGLEEMKKKIDETIDTEEQSLNKDNKKEE